MRWFLMTNLKQMHMMYVPPESDLEDKWSLDRCSLDEIFTKASKICFVQGWIERQDCSNVAWFNIIEVKAG